MTESILDALEPADAERVLAAGNALTVPQGWSPIAAGTPADKAYLITEGEVSVRKGGVEIATLGPGAVVGESAIVNRTLRTATVVAVTPLGGWQAAGALLDPVALLAGLAVGVSSSVIPYVTDQLAMARLPRATYALMVSLLPATATVVGLVVLAQVPAWREVAGVALVVAAVGVHRDAR